MANDKPFEVYIKMSRIFGGGFTPDLTRCRCSVPDGGRSVGSHQCHNKAKVFRDCIVKNDPDNEGVQSVGFCTTHDPVKVEERRVADRAKRDREYEARKKAMARKHDRPVDYKLVLRQIAAGHNDPRKLAADILAQWGDAE